MLEQIAGIQDFIRGSVVLMKRPCTYPGCRRCAAGRRHESWVMSVSKKGRTKTVYLGAGRLEEARRMVAQYHRFMDLVEEVSDINRALLAAQKTCSDKGGKNAAGGKGSRGVSKEGG